MVYFFQSVFEMFQSICAIFQPSLGRNLFERLYHVKLKRARVQNSRQSHEVEAPQPERYKAAAQTGYPEEELLYEKFAPAAALHVAQPVIVFLHGGCWVASDRNDPHGVHRSFCRALAARGFPVVNANYRLCRQAQNASSGSIGINDQLDDLAALCKHLVAGDVFSCQKVGLLLVGHSAGGHLVLQAALSGKLHEWETTLRGLYVLSGVYDLAEFQEKASLFVRHLALSRIPDAQLGRECLRSLSPKYARNNFANNGGGAAKINKPNDGNAATLRCPVRLVHGATDGFLLIQAQECVLNLQAWKNRASLRILPRHDHFSILSVNNKNDDAVLNDLCEFAQDAAHSFVSGKAI